MATKTILVVCIYYSRKFEKLNRSQKKTYITVFNFCTLA